MIIAMRDPPSLPELAHLLDQVLNADGPRNEGFILVRFRHGTIGRPNYVSTVHGDETLRLLKLMIAQIEGRIEGRIGHA